MALPRTSIRSFLIQAKTALRSAIANKQPVTLVIGNSSADLDSLTSALVYAYLRSTTASPPSPAHLHIPLANIPASALRLRPELHALLPHAGLAPHHLLTLDDLPAAAAVVAALPPENTRWVLVDHNALQGRLGALYGARVVGAVDHHADERAVPPDTGVEPRVIAAAGSCTSLVVEVCREAWDAAGDAVGPDAEGVRLWDAQVATLAIASVLVDTRALRDESRVTAHDVRAVEYLEAKIAAAGAAWDRERFYREIEGAKGEVGALGVGDLLARDYKEWEEGRGKVGISSVGRPVAFLRERASAEAGGKEGDAALVEAMRGFAEERGLSVYAVMTTSTSDEGEFRRELLVWALDRDSIGAAKRFADGAAEELGLEEWRGQPHGLDELDTDREWRKVWRQRKVENSRKQVAPLLREAMR